MKHIKSYTYLLMAMFFTACGSETPYTPAEPVSADNWGVYFDGDNDSDYPRSLSDPNTFDITVKRVNTNGELTVPIVVENTTGKLAAPESVTFADGEVEQSFSVTYSGLEGGKVEGTLTIPTAYTNPYTEKNGFWKQRVVVYQPTIVSSNVVMDFDAVSSGTDKGTFDEEVYTITQVPGENRFFWNNFLNTGFTLAFMIDETDGNGNFDPTDTKKCYGSIVPTNHYYDDGAYGWYLCTQADTSQGYTKHAWSHNGDDITSMYFYWGTYTYIDFREIQGKESTYGYGRFAPLVQNGDWYYYDFYIYYDKE
ncbi:MAG: hypothetical protein HUK08_06060 [Bacteroidaceae bacterium]|nr:hypothetical protein [Bacteroidaceae bacterium]